MARSDRYTSTGKKEEIYSDFTTNLDPHPDKRDLVRRTNEDAVRRSILNLVMTSKYERPFKANIGAGIRRLLFEPITPQTQATLTQLIRGVIENYEPRAKLIDVVVSAFPDESAYAVSIVFYTINKTEPTTLDATLFRVR